MTFKDINGKLNVEGDDCVKKFLAAMDAQKADLPIVSSENIEKFLAEINSVSPSFLESDSSTALLI